MRRRKLLPILITVLCAVGLLKTWQVLKNPEILRGNAAAIPGFGADGDGFSSRTGSSPRDLERETWRPSRIPDRIILSWTKDPAHSQAVTWRTDTTASKALAELALAFPGPKPDKKPARIDALTTLLESDLGKANYHTVLFDDLAPSTRYAYRVGDGVNWSEWIHFQTASDKAEQFTFVYFGDAQNDIKSLWSRVIREAYADAPRARFLLHAGDLVNIGDRDAEWGEWFGAAGWVNAMIPCVATPGNHEYVAKKLTSHWRPQFAFPENGPKGLEEVTYYLDFQGTRIISLDSNVEQERQVPWLENMLAKNSNTWTIVTFHHPLFAAAKGRDNAKLRALWKPVLDKYRVDLVLQGHDHTYTRTGLDVPENISQANLSSGADRTTSHGATVYVISVSGPKMYKLERQPYMKRAAEQTQLYQIIHIDGPELRYEARTATGDLYDAFTLKKRPGKSNELVERIPDTSERILPATQAASVVETK
jgi:3',5'-cyclic AMP phosphodiesterase CpdA